MITQEGLSASIAAYEKEMLEAIQASKSILLPQPTSVTFSTLNLNTAFIKELAKNLPTGHKNEDKDAEYIYIFTLADDNQIATEEVLSTFISARDWQDTEEYDGKKNLCRPNDAVESSNVVYVGRSYKPRDRFKQHLSANTTGTYAIHFAFWASELDIKFNFYLYRFSGLGNHVVQVLEDGLWDNYKPLLGKRGEK